MSDAESSDGGEVDEMPLPGLAPPTEFPTVAPGDDWRASPRQLGFVNDVLAVAVALEYVTEVATEVTRRPRFLRPPAYPVSFEVSACVAGEATAFVRAMAMSNTLAMANVVRLWTTLTTIHVVVTFVRPADLVWDGGKMGRIRWTVSAIRDFIVEALLSALPWRARATEWASMDALPGVSGAVLRAVGGSHPTVVIQQGCFDKFMSDASKCVFGTPGRAILTRLHSDVSAKWVLNHRRAKTSSVGIQTTAGDIFTVNGSMRDGTTTPENELEVVAVRAPGIAHFKAASCDTLVDTVRTWVLRGYPVVHGFDPCALEGYPEDLVKSAMETHRGMEIIARERAKLCHRLALVFIAALVGNNVAPPRPIADPEYLAAVSLPPRAFDNAMESARPEPPPKRAKDAPIPWRSRRVRLGDLVSLFTFSKMTRCSGFAATARRGQWLWDVALFLGGKDKGQDDFDALTVDAVLRGSGLCLLDQLLVQD